MFGKAKPLNSFYFMFCCMLVGFPIIHSEMLFGISNSCLRLVEIQLTKLNFFLMLVALGQC